MRPIQVGDLCTPFNVIQHKNATCGFISVCDETVLEVLFDLSEQDMVMVTGHGEHSVARSGIELLVGVLRNAHDVDKTKVLQVVVASGPHAGMVGYVPSFWLRTIVAAG